MAKRKKKMYRVRSTGNIYGHWRSGRFWQLYWMETDDVTPAMWEDPRLEIELIEEAVQPAIEKVSDKPKGAKKS